ncbi:MAG: PaaI family thioesterase [Polyangiales bacterium]
MTPAVLPAPPLQLDAATLDAFLRAAFPDLDVSAEVTGLTPGRLRLRQPIARDHLRPGETLSGPTLMTLADTAMYLLVLAHIGLEPMAVTSHLSIDFLRRAQGTVALADATLLRLGRRNAVGQVLLYVEGDDAPVAAAQVTYALPPRV